MVLACELKASFVFSNEFQPEFLAGGCMNHVINEHSIHNPLATLMLDEDDLLTS